MPKEGQPHKLIPGETYKKKAEIKTATILTEDEAILRQIKAEYKEALNFIQPKREEWFKRLKLYNNQKREKDKVGVPTFYSAHNTLLSAFYFDRLQVEFQPRSEEDVEKVEVLNPLAKFDHQEMSMPEIEYDWLWDTLFFGKGFCELAEWNTVKNNPVPKIIDPLTFLHDPNATKIQEARYWGREILMTKKQMEDNKNFKNLEKLADIRTGISQTATAQQKRAEAQGQQPFTVESIDYENKQYTLLEWLTLIDGKKSIIVCDLGFNYIFRGPEELIFKDGLWPVVEKSFSPIAHDMWGVSVADLVEDKQRTQAILSNLAIEMIKSYLYPMYLFDPNAVSKFELEDFKFNKFIPTTGNPAAVVAPMNKPQPGQSFFAAYDLIDRWLQQATSAVSTKQGLVLRKTRTYGEASLAETGAELRQSLPAKLFANSEVMFWRMWYSRYKQFFSRAKQKVIRIQGTLGPSFKKIGKKDILTVEDPDVIVESRLVSEYKKIVERRDFSTITPLLMSASTEISGKRYIVRKLLKLYDWVKDEIDQALPQTIDELQAEKENVSLAANKVVLVSPNEDHYTHIMIHKRLNETNAQLAHIEGHKMMIMAARERPELFHLPKLETVPSISTKVEKEEKKTLRTKAPIVPRE